MEHTKNRKVVLMNKKVEWLYFYHEPIRHSGIIEFGQTIRTVEQRNKDKRSIDPWTLIKKYSVAESKLAERELKRRTKKYRYRGRTEILKIDWKTLEPIVATIVEKYEPVEYLKSLKLDQFTDRLHKEEQAKIESKSIEINDLIERETRQYNSIINKDMTHDKKVDYYGSYFWLVPGAFIVFPLILGSTDTGGYGMFILLFGICPLIWLMTLPMKAMMSGDKNDGIVNKIKDIEEYYRNKQDKAITSIKADTEFLIERERQKLWPKQQPHPREIMKDLYEKSKKEPKGSTKYDGLKTYVRYHYHYDESEDEEFEGERI